MEDDIEYIKIPLIKVIDLILAEERAKIRKHYNDVLGKATADHMDSYLIVDCELMKIIKD